MERIYVVSRIKSGNYGTSGKHFLGILYEYSFHAPFKHLCRYWFHWYFRGFYKMAH